LNRKTILIIALLILAGCAGTKLVGSWKNPDYVIFDAKQVLVVGMAQDRQLRLEFESRLVEQFKREGVEAVRSMDVFDLAFTSAQRSEEELEDAMELLIDRDFDAILLTKLIGMGHRVTLRESVADIDRAFDTFSTDYLEHQEIYYDPKIGQEYDLFHLETSLYCICVGKERELVWRGNIDLVEPMDTDKVMDSYIALIRGAMEEDDVIF